MAGPRIVLLAEGETAAPSVTWGDCEEVLARCFPDFEVEVRRDREIERLDGVACVVGGRRLGGEGLADLERIRDRDPDLPFVYLAGEDREDLPVEALTMGVTATLSLGSHQDPEGALVDAVAGAIGEDGPTVPIERSETPETVDAPDSASTVDGPPSPGTPDHRETSIDSPSPPDPDAGTAPTGSLERRKRLEHYETMVETVADPMYSLDEAGRFTYVNWAVCDLLGYDRSDLVGEPVGTVITDEFVERSTALIRRLWDDEERDYGTVEGELVTRDGERIPVENNIRILESDGEFQGSVGVVRDVSDRKQRERELEQYETVVQTVPDGVFVLDDVSNIVAANEQGAAILGLSVEEAVGRSVPGLIVDDVIGEEIITGYKEVVRDLLSSSSDADWGTYEFPVWPADGDGERRLVEARIALRPYDEEFRGAVGIMRDVTERKERIAELERYETLIEAIPDPLYATDEVGYLTFINRAGLDAYEIEWAEVEDRDVHFSEFVAEEDVGRFQEATRRMLSSEYETGPKSVIEHTAVTNDGRRFAAENHFALMSPTEEGVAGAGIVRDVSDRKRLQQRLQVLDRVLRHNLRNDCNVVMRYTEQLGTRLREDHDDPAGAEIATNVRRRIEDLVELSRDVRRLQDVLERESLDDARTDLVDVVETVVEEYRSAHPSATVETDLPATAPVAVDSAVELVVENLVENAIEHNDGEPTVTVTVERAADGDENREWIRLRVADDGPGIPEAERVVFDEDVEVTPLRHGSGIGLWAVAWIVQSFDGVVEVEDRDPRGAVVSVSIPGLR